MMETNTARTKISIPRPTGPIQATPSAAPTTVKARTPRMGNPRLAKVLHRLTAVIAAVADVAGIL